MVVSSYWWWGQLYFFCFVVAIILLFLTTQHIIIINIQIITLLEPGFDISSFHFNVITSVSNEILLEYVPNSNRCFVLHNDIKKLEILFIYLFLEWNIIYLSCIGLDAPKCSGHNLLKYGVEHIIVSNNIWRYDFLKYKPKHDRIIWIVFQGNRSVSLSHVGVFPLSSTAFSFLKCSFPFLDRNDL